MSTIDIKNETAASQPQYSNPDQQAAYETGVKQGRIEGVLAYQKHIIDQVTNEREKLSLKLQKGGRS
jgi:hypothetical protein